jgi:hypothetical protein
MIADQELVTVFVPDEPTQLALVESVLREHEIPFAAKNLEVQNLFGAGEIGAGNFAIGPVKIQVSGADAGRAQALIAEAVGEAAARSAAAGEEVRSPIEEECFRYSRYSIVWSMLWFGGVGSLLAVYFGLKALALRRQVPDLSLRRAKFGLSLGVIGLAYDIVWLFMRLSGA